MTANPLARRQQQAAPGVGDPLFVCNHTSKQAWCDYHNERLKRDDIYWAVDDNDNLVMRDRDDWSLRRMKEIAEHREAERQRFNHRQRYPISGGDGDV